MGSAYQYLGAAASLLTCTAADAAVWNPSLPARGYNSWFAFDVHLNETNMRSNADALVSTGLAAAGYVFCNMDGGWQGGRYANHSVYANATLFPSGLAALADYVHERGLLFGGYTDRGPETCDGHTGSLNLEALDAAQYAAWGMDYVKEDSCFATQSHSGALAQYSLMQASIAATGRPMVFSLCGWLKWYGAAGPAGVGASWRIGPDALSWENVLLNIDAAADVAPFVSAGHFADVDEVMGPSRGRPISRAQELTQIAIIAIIGSPLLISFDLSGRTADDPDVAPFLNPEMLAVHWDPAPGGPRYKRLAGGYVASAEISPLTGLPCDGSAGAAAQWRFRAASPDNATVGTLESLGAPGWCLRAGPAWFGTCNNAQQAWLSPCGGPSCCDANCTNQLFAVNASGDGTIQTLVLAADTNAAGPWLTQDSVPNALFFEERFNATHGDPAAQAWAFDAATGLLSNGSPPASHSCVGGRPRDDKNVWGRALASGGAWALLFANFNATQAQAVTCDAGCFAAAGFAPDTTLAVRDIWARTDNGTAVAGAGYTVSLPAGGASAFLRFTPVAV